MYLRIPSYYTAFECIADRCQDTCCAGWEIDIDDDTWEYYNQIEGPFGERIKSVLSPEKINKDHNCFKLTKNRRCPFLNEKNLCDLILELGEESLCEVCTEYPRFTLDHGNVRERSLAISCEEVGRLIFSSDEKISITETEIPDIYEWEEEADEEELLLSDVLSTARDTAILLLQNRSLSLEDRIGTYLSFCKNIQEYLNQNDYEGIRDCCAGASADPLKFLLNQKETRFSDPVEAFFARKSLLNELEVLDSEWDTAIHEVKAFYETHAKEDLLTGFSKLNAHLLDRTFEYEHLLVYFTFRYFSKSVFDCRFFSKAQYAVFSFLVIRDLDLVRFEKQNQSFTSKDRIDTARIYAKEVEHSEENLEELEELFLFEDCTRIEELFSQVNTGR